MHPGWSPPAAPLLPQVWGIVNVTPDSFSDGGRYPDVEAAVAHALRLVAEGADVVDVGGESTRPGARPVDPEAEGARVVPVVRALAREDPRVPISVDTRRAAVARAALDAGATIVNDVSAGTHSPEMLALVASRGAAIVLMHMKGTPADMQVAPRYRDVRAEVAAWLDGRAEAARRAGVPGDRIWVDPGIGFGKTLEHNLDLMRGLEGLVARGTPVLLGASRKSFLGRLTGRAVHERLAASLACVVRAAEAGVAAVRVHDVAPTVDVLGTWAHIRRVVGRAPGE